MPMIKKKPRIPKSESTRWYGTTENTESYSDIIEEEDEW